MKKIILSNIRPISLTVLVFAFFMLSSWVSREHAGVLADSALAESKFGPIAYFSVKVVDVIFAGFSSSPLIPLARALWGTAAAIALTSLGWTAGSLIAFFLARSYGEKFVCRVINKCDLENYENSIKTKGLFWRLTLARVFLPVDIVSYAVGLFSRMKWWTFALSTLIGSAAFTSLAIFASGFTLAAQAVAGLFLFGTAIFWLKGSYQSIFG